MSGERDDLSSEDVENCIRIFMQTSSELTPNKGWSATPKSTNVYAVSYDFNDGSLGEQQAMWEADLISKQVKYINKHGMYFQLGPQKLKARMSAWAPFSFRNRLFFISV